MRAAQLGAQRQSVAFGGTASRLQRQTPGSRAGQGSQSRPAAWAVGSTRSSRGSTPIVMPVGERHRAVVWILTSFKEHRSSRMDPILHVSSAPEPDAERIIGDGLKRLQRCDGGICGSGAPTCSRQRSRQRKGRRRHYRQNVTRADVHRSRVSAGNPTGSRYRCSHDEAGGGRSASAWLPGRCSLHDQLPGTRVL
jgi:hypothetical protein